MNWAKMPSKAHLIQGAIFLASLGMLVTSIWLVYRIDVITKWDLQLPSQDIHVGDEIIVKSVYTKIRDADGVSQRSLDCRNKDGIFIRYPLNQAIANRAARSGGTGIVITIPEVPDLPTKCKIAVAIKYEVIKIGKWVIREVPESNETKEFTLLPKREEADDVSSETTQTPAGVSGVQSPELGNASSTSSPNNTPSQVSQQSNTSQEPASESETSQPSLIESILAPITNLLGGNR